MGTNPISESDGELGHVLPCAHQQGRTPVDDTDTTQKRLALSPTEAARAAGVGRTTLYIALGSGDLKSFCYGRRRLIRVESLNDWLQRLEAAHDPA
jgi:excisionase family DNA binding protein